MGSRDGEQGDLGSSTIRLHHGGYLLHKLSCRHQHQCTDTRHNSTGESLPHRTRTTIVNGNRKGKRQHAANLDDGKRVRQCLSASSWCGYADITKSRVSCGFCSQDLGYNSFLDWKEPRQPSCSAGIQDGTT